MHLNLSGNMKIPNNLPQITSESPPAAQNSQQDLLVQLTDCNLPNTENAVKPCEKIDRLTGVGLKKVKLYRNCDDLTYLILCHRIWSGQI